MRFFLLLLAGLALSLRPAQAQLSPLARSIVDSLRREARAHPTDSMPAFYLARTSELWRAANPDSAVAYARRAVPVARPYPRLAVLSYNMLAIGLYYKADYPGALAAFDSAYQLARHHGNVQQMGVMTNNAANVYIEMGDYAGALRRYRKALSISRQADDAAGEAMALGNIGYAYKDIGDYERALRYFFRSRRMVEAKLRQPGLDSLSWHLTNTARASVLSYIGETYKQLNDWPRARRYLTEALAIYRREHHTDGSGTTQRQLAAGNAANGQPILALSQFRSALDLQTRVHDIPAQAQSHADIGELLLRQGQAATAVAEYERAVALNQQTHNVRNQSTAFTGLAAARLAAGQVPAARAALDSARRYVARTNAHASLRDFYQTVSHYFAQTAQPAAALASYRRYADYKDSLLTAANVKAMADVAVKYDTEKKEQQLHVQQAELGRQQAQLSRSRLISWGMLAGAGAALALAWSAYRRYRLRQQARLQAEIAHQQVLATRAVLAAEEQERRRIAADLHDGVGQVMSAAKLNLAAIADELPFASAAQQTTFQNAMSLVDDSCREVRAVSHAMMPNALLRAGLGAAVREFLGQIDQRVIKIHLLTEGLNDKLSPNLETMLYRVVQECVGNVIKHAQASRLDISLRRDEEGITALIEDDGRGFDATAPAFRAGLGLQNIRARLALLGGQAEWDSHPGRGTSVTVFVPTAGEADGV